MEIVSLNQVSEDLLWKCAKLYCKIWKEPPWNEEFWKPEEVVHDIKQQLEKPCAEGFFSFHDSTLAGFTWGYSVSKPEINIISGNERLDSLFFNDNKVFYVDELGVALSFRRKGIGESLTRTLLGAIKKHSINLVALRTDKKANAARSLYQKIGFKDLLIEDEKYPDRTYWLLSF